MIKASIIIPTRNRSHLLLDRYNILFNNTMEISLKEAEVIYVVDEDDLESINVLGDLYIIPISGSNYNRYYVTSKQLETPANKWNLAAKYAKGEWLVTISDDCIPQENWLSNALNTRNYGFLGLPDGVTGDRNKQFTPLYMATREWLKKWNGGVLVIPKYKIWFADIETCARAQSSLTYKVAWNSVVKQLHADFGTAENDEIYEIGRAKRIEDKITFEERKLRNFPDNFESVL